MNQLNCPNCASPLSPSFSAAKVTTCPACDTTVFIDGELIAAAGESGTMHDAPLLFHLGDTISVGPERFIILGHARFDYGPGWWDEYWAINMRGHGKWISVDEGEVIVQEAVRVNKAPTMTKPPSLGETFSALQESFSVTEVDRATCVAMRGSFPEQLVVGEVFDYANCMNEYSELLSGEFSGNETAWFTGQWCDPFDIEVISSA